MASVRKTFAPATWSALSGEEQRLLARLTLSDRRDGKLIIDGLWGVTLTTAERDTADELLVRGLVAWRDLVLRATSEGIRVVVQESGLVTKRRAVG
jgi:hypothetical protein